MTRKEALAVLWRNDHGFLTPDAAVKIQEAFGMKPHVQTQRANTGHPKGLRVDHLGKNARVQGYDAADLAADVAYHLGLEFKSAFGRGTRLRNACDAIQKFLEAAEPTPTTE